MGDLHPLGVISDSQKSVEAVDPKFIIDGLLFARRRTVDAVEKIPLSLQEGMTELSLIHI